MKTNSGLANYDSEIQDLRTQINLLDEKIVDLLKKRLSLVLQAREIKHVDGIPLHSLEREKVVIQNATSDSTGFEKEYLEEIYRLMLETTRRIADQNS